MKRLIIGLMLPGIVQAQVMNFENVYIAPNEEIHITEALTNDGNMVVDNTALLYVEDELVNNGNITFEENSSLLRGTSGAGVTNDGTGSGTYVYKRQGTINPDVYNFWSSPMQAQASGVIGSSYMYNPLSGTVDISDDAFDPGWVNPGGTMAVGRGYASMNAGLVSFSGDVNNGTLAPYAVSSYSNPDPMAGGTPFNLIGNPYPSGLSVSDFVFRNSVQLGLISGAIYLWDDPGNQPYNSQDYATINSAGTVTNGNGSFNSSSWEGSIGAGQGFKVEAISNGSVEFNNTMRTHNNSQFFRMANDLVRFWVSVGNADGLRNESLIAFVDDATEGRDHPYDAKKLIGQIDLSLFTLMDGDAYAIQGFPPLTDYSKIIDMGVSHGAPGEYHFKLDVIENWYLGVPIYLEDTQTGIWTDLTQDSIYEYSATEGIDLSRFKLRFIPPSVTSVVESTQLKFTAYQNWTNLVLDFIGSDVRNAEVELFDMLGKSVIGSKNYSANANRISIPVSRIEQGTYIVRVSTTNFSEARKVHLR